MPNSSQIFVAKESFSTVLDGQEIIVNRGQTRVRAGHPLLKGREIFFEPLEVHYEVETADARPGVSRGAPQTTEPVEAPAPEPKVETATASSVKAKAPVKE